MTELLLTRGLPGSGKTTWALDLAKKSAGKWARSNRDDTRMAIYDVRHGLTWEQEQIVTTHQQAAVRGLLRAGINVVVDDTNLNRQTTTGWLRLAEKEMALLSHRDFDVPLQECVWRVQRRAMDGGHFVPESAVRRMHDRYLKKGFPEFPANRLGVPKPYVPDTDKPRAVIVDIDGTMTTGPHERGPFEWKKVGQDKPNEPVISMVEGLAEDYEVIFLSGRSEEAREDTEAWLYEHFEYSPTALFMRAKDDYRPDHLIKAEIFDREIRDKFNVAAVFDDRDQVVRYWRSIGLTCLQVAEGDF